MALNPEQQALANKFRMFGIIGILVGLPGLQRFVIGDSMRGIIYSIFSYWIYIILFCWIYVALKWTIGAVMLTIAGILCSFIILIPCGLCVGCLFCCPCFCCCEPLSYVFFLFPVAGTAMGLYDVVNAEEIIASTEGKANAVQPTA